MTGASPSRDPTGRFTDRVRDYVRYRPDYPRALLARLREDGLNGNSVVADVGSGTGIFASLLLESGAEVYAVEPNRAMREAAERWLGEHPRFRSVAGTAERSGLPSDSCDFVTAAQAFHWFDVEAARREFMRILRAGGRVALVWNARREEGTPFLRDYEKLLVRFGTDYAQVSHRRYDAARIRSFFGAEAELASFPHHQDLDREGLRGRLLSSSYTPAAGNPAREPMLRELDAIFDRHEKDGRVRIEYDTELYVGRVGPSACPPGRLDAGDR